MVVPVNKVVKRAGHRRRRAPLLRRSLLRRSRSTPSRAGSTRPGSRRIREGVYYGQCSELCGNGHPYMPITIRVVSEAQYAAWLAEAKQKYAAIDGAGSDPARRRAIV